MVKEERVEEREASWAASSGWRPVWETVDWWSSVDRGEDSVCEDCELSGTAELREFCGGSAVGGTESSDCVGPGNSLCAIWEG